MPYQDRMLSTHLPAFISVPVKPATDTQLLNMSALQVSVFGPINSLCNHAHIHVYNTLIGVVAAGICSAKYY